jgi:CMP/dCMP kinase
MRRAVFVMPASCFLLLVSCLLSLVSRSPLPAPGSLFPYPRPVFRLDQDLTLTIDGPAASGKSATAKLLARELGLSVLNTGAMYRCATALAIEHNCDVEHEKRLVELVRAGRMHFDWKKDPPEIIAEGRSFMQRITDRDVSALVSRYSDCVPLRQLLVGMQRDVRDAHPRLVSEGRDQGSVVFPDADVKFYLHATPMKRAERRRDQLLHEKGLDINVQQLAEEIAQRDERDRRKPYGALTKPEGAFVVDSTELSLAQVVDVMKMVVVRKARRASGPAGSEDGHGTA